ncbi:MAG: PadR family transcriptional regulator [Anaerolineales bacterium]
MPVPLPDQTVLGLLAAKPQHGYELLSHFQNKSELGRVWTLSSSQLYAVLKRLEQSGFAKGRWKESSRAPAKRQYTITASGKRQLDSWLYSTELSSSIRTVRVQFLSRLYIAKRLGIPLRPLIENQRRVCKKQSELLRKIREDGSRGIEPLVLGFVLGQLEAVLKWLDEVEKTASKLRLPG